MSLLVRKTKPSTPYLHHAGFAVGFERDGNFADAVLSWELAERAAVKEIDRMWADERRAFCTRAMAHGWGQHYAGS